MSDRRMTERRDDARPEQDVGGDRRANNDRRMIERFTNRSVRECVEQVQFWLRVLFVVLVSFGGYQLIQASLAGEGSAGPGLLNAVLLFSSAYFTFAPMPWCKAYLMNESVSNFENLFDRLTAMVRFGSFLAALYLVVFIVKHL